MLRAVAGALAALVLAGCLAAPGTPSRADSAPAAPLGLDLHLSGCARWDAQLVVPAALDHGSVPRGWAGAQPLATLGLQGWACQRLSLGAFERPVHLILEAHDLAEVPAGCLGNATATRVWVVESAWADDAQVAHALRADYGLPAHQAAIAVQDAGAGPTTLHEWSWAGSRVTVPDDGTQDRGPPLRDRFFWARGAGVGSLDLAQSATQPAAAPRPVQGTAAPPLLFAALPAFAAPGGWSPHASADGRFTLYEDLACARLSS
ncbi:MAG: hypothetical protein QOI63_1137 [Thermoplasmata archaeon]|nr:hypothetical protein [Thermoplasmata archaeon]